MATRSASPEATKARATSADQARRGRVQVALANPVFFGEVYVRPLDERWNAALPALAQEMIAWIRRVRRGVLITPPEFLKTTMISQLYPLWLTYRYAALGRLGLLTGMLLSEEQDMAEGNLSVTVWHIENNGRLAGDFVDSEGRPLVAPDPDEDKWTDSEIVVRRPGVQKDPTWQAKGLRSQGIQGSRLQHLIGDDLITPASSHSPAKQKEARRLWDTQVTTRVFEDGQAVIAGNFNHPKDLLSELSARPSYAVMRRPALHVRGRPERAPRNPRSRAARLALPERWSRDRLLQELSDKPATFAQVYLLRAGVEGGNLLKDGWVQRIDRSQIQTAAGQTILLSVDPAPGSETDPDPSYFNITVGILTPSHLDVVESFVDRLEPTEQVELLGQMVDRYNDYSAVGHVGGIGVAKIALDRYFRGAVEIGRPDLRPLLHEHSLPGDKSKTDRLAHLGSYTKNGWCRVTEAAWTSLTSSADHRQQEESLAEQWTALPNQNHDDRLDGLDVLIREAVERLGGNRTVIASGESNGPVSPTADLLEKDM